MDIATNYILGLTIGWQMVWNDYPLILELQVLLVQVREKFPAIRPTIHYIGPQLELLPSPVHRHCSVKQIDLC